MARFRLTIAYEGTHFHGWQKQYAPAETAPKASIVTCKGGDPNAREGFVQLRTVQWAVEEALFEVYRTRLHVQGASRTDSGVHALAQTGAFTAPDAQSPPEERLAMALNSRLPDDALITRAVRTRDDFEPTTDCTAKGYRYSVLAGRTRPLWDRRTVYHTNSALDLDAMRRAAEPLVGEHDFAAFAQASHGRESTVRTVFACDVNRDERGITSIDVSGNGFLYNMVRILAGTLMEAGRGTLDPNRIPEILESKDRTANPGPTLPPQGLRLEWIRY